MEKVGYLIAHVVAGYCMNSRYFNLLYYIYYNITTTPGLLKRHRSKKEKTT